MQIGVVSDTHGLLRPELLPLLEGSDHILHCGDVGDPEILGQLAKIAPVTAIRGNIDTHGPCSQLPATEVVTLAGLDFYLLHDVHQLDLDPTAAGFTAVLYGHSHKPEIRHHKGVLYLNPGSCGRRRFKLPISCARIDVDENEVDENRQSEDRLKARILELPIPYR
jgi:uncharacterized protein